MKSGGLGSSKDTVVPGGTASSISAKACLSPVPRFSRCPAGGPRATTAARGSGLSCLSDHLNLRKTGVLGGDYPQGKQRLRDWGRAENTDFGGFGQGITRSSTAQNPPRLGSSASQELGVRDNSSPSIGRQLTGDELATFHDHGQIVAVLQNGDVFSGIAVDHEEVSELAGLNDAAILAE